VTLKRGFKAAAERQATQLRADLGLGPSDVLDVVRLAKHLEVAIVSADELVDIERLEELERIQAFAFSACTFNIDGRHIIVVNPLRTPGRRASDIAHELSHVLLSHELSEVVIINDIPFRTCRPDQEEEATTLGGTILLPRSLLLRAAQRGYGAGEIAKLAGVTDEMARYRYNTTGVGNQAGRS
jgi:Zn-dependent peptidase ImmA (M78 family)